MTDFLAELAKLEAQILADEKDALDYESKARAARARREEAKAKRAEIQRAISDAVKTQQLQDANEAANRAAAAATAAKQAIDNSAADLAAKHREADELLARLKAATPPAGDLAAPDATPAR